MTASTNAARFGSDVCCAGLQTLSSRAYKESYTHRRLIHEDQCINIKNVIPDTNGMGVPNGAFPHWTMLVTQPYK